MEAKPKNVEEYIASFPMETRLKLNEIRSIILKSAPNAAEVISYNMPAYKLNGILVYFAGCKNHIGFYPTPSAIKAFEDQLKKYNYSKGAVQFPINQPLPEPLIIDMVLFKITENSRFTK